MLQVVRDETISDFVGRSVKPNPSRICAVCYLKTTLSKKNFFYQIFLSAFLRCVTVWPLRGGADTDQCVQDAPIPVLYDVIALNGALKILALLDAQLTL